MESFRLSNYEDHEELLTHEEIETIITDHYRKFLPKLVFELYFVKEFTQEEVAAKLSISVSTIYRIFKKHKWKPRRIISRTEIDPEIIHNLYFKEKLSQREIAEELKVSSRTIMRIFQDQKWTSRSYKKYHTKEQRGIGNRNRGFRFRNRLEKLRKDLFGEVCFLCGEKRKIAIHNKYGEEHHQDALWRLHFLKSLNPNDWVALCIPCHRGVHWMMDELHQEWQYIENSKGLVRRSDQENNRLEIPKKNELSSTRYIELKKMYGNDIEKLRRAIFGDKCYFCGTHYTKKRVSIHRKDGRPHEVKLTVYEKYFRTLDPTEWVALCQNHHRQVHWAMEVLGLSWTDLETSIS